MSGISRWLTSDSNATHHYLLVATSLGNELQDILR